MRRTIGARAAEERLAALTDYVATMEEPLEAALDLTRGLTLAAQGLDDRENGRTFLALGRLIGGQLCAIKSTLATLLKACAERA